MIHDNYDGCHYQYDDSYNGVWYWWYSIGYDGWDNIVV